MQILWLTEHAYPGLGGMATSCERQVAGLRGLGARVDVIHLTGDTDDIETTVELGGERVRAPMGDDAAHGLNVLWAHLAQRGTRWTHVLAFGGNLPLLAGPVFASWLGLPLITELRGNDFDTGVFQPARRAVLEEALRRSAQVVTVSRDMRTRLLALYPTTRVNVIANGIALDHWQALPSDRANAAAWRAGLGITQEAGRVVLGLFGQIKPKKGGVFLLEAIMRAGLAERVHLLCAGAVDEAVTMWLAGHPVLAVTQVAAMDRYALIPWYLACDAVAVPSWYDGMPNVVLEAGGLGVPVLASSAGGMPDVLADVPGATLFAPGDLDDCAAVLEAFVAAPPAARRQMGLDLRRHVAVHFQAEQEIRALEALLGDTPISARAAVQ